MSAKVNDSKLIDLVKLNKQLYAKCHPEYRNTEKKNLIWEAIGVALGSTGDICRRRFLYLKCRFNKEKRKGDLLSQPNIQSIYKKMMFLWDHLYQKKEVVALKEELVDTEEFRKEVDKQMQILKECGETKELQEAVEKQIRILKECEEKEESQEKEDKQMRILKDCEDKEESQEEQDKQMLLLKDCEEKEDTQEEEDKHIRIVKECEETGESQEEGDKHIRIVKECGETEDSQDEEDKHIRILRECEETELNYAENNVEDIPVEVIILHDGETVECANQEDIVEKYFETELDFCASGTKEILNKSSEDADKVEKRDPAELNEEQKPTIFDSCNETDNSTQKSSGGSSKPRSLSKRNYTRKHQNKKRKITGESVYQTSNSQMLKSCNEIFCKIARQYLDKINSREKMSRVRLQIMTILHNELYSGR